MNKYIVALLFTLCSTGLSAQYWQKCNVPAPFNTYYYLDVFILPSNPLYGWVAGFNGSVLRTTDGGTTWQGAVVPYNGRNAGHLESVHFPSAQIGYCSGPCGVFKSTDGGASWSDITPPIPSGQNPWGLYFLNDTWGVVLAGGCASPQYFLQTSNGGASWSTFTGNLGSCGLSDAILFPNGSGIAVGSGNLWSSNDSGRTWSPYQPPFNSYWDEEITASGSSIMVPWSGNTCQGGGTGGGVRFSTDNGATWNSYNTNNNMFGAFLLSPSKGWACGNAKNMWRTTDAGTTWELKNCGIDGDLDDCWFVNDSTGFVVGNAVYRYMPAERSLSKSTIDFGTFCFPGERFDTVWVRNRSMNSISANWQLSGADVQHFNVLQPLSVNFGIPSCDSAMIIVRFQPRSVGTKSCTLTVNVSGFAALNVSITGSTRNNGALPADTLAILNPAQCGTPVRVVSLWNNITQLTDQIIQIQRVSGAVFTPEVGLPILIPPGGGSVGFSIVLADTGWQTARYMMRVGPCLKDTIITVKAYGVSPIINAPTQRTYISSCMGSVLDSIPVTNTGNADLIISNNYIASGASDFSILGWAGGETLPVTIKRNATKYLLVRFTPLGAGPRSAVLKLTNNDQTTARGTRTLIDILLQGQSSGVSDSLSMRVVDFGTMCAPASKTKIVTLTNTGTSDFTVDARMPSNTTFKVLADRALATVLHSGDSISFSVSFTANAPGLYTDSLVISVTPCDSVPIVIPIRALVVNTVLTTVPSRIDSTMRVGTTARFTVELRSTGSSNAFVDAIVLSPNRPDWKIINPPSLPFTLRPGDVITITIEVSPTSSATISGQLLVNASSQCSTSVSVPITINVTQTQLSLSRSSIDFGREQCQILDRSDSIIIRNDGATPDSLMEAFIESPPNNTFRLATTLSLPLAIVQGQPITLAITSQQKLEGIDSTSLVLRFVTSYSGAQIRVPLRREFHATKSSVSERLIDFGQAQPCDAPRQLTVHFRNDGTLDDDLSVDVSKLDPSMTLSASRLNLRAGSVDSVLITCTPQGQSPRSIVDSLIWKSSVCPLSLAVKLTAQILDPHLTISPTSINFGRVWKGTMSTAVVGISNHSDAPRRLVNISCTGPQSQDFIIDYIPNQLLNVGDSVSATVQYTGGAVGDAVATLLVRESSSCDDSTVVALSAQVPKEFYSAHLTVQKAVVVTVNDTADIAVRLITNDTSEQALFKAKPSSISTSLNYDYGVMNVLRVFRHFNGKDVDVPHQRTGTSMSVTIADTLAANLGSTDTLFFIRAQGMQNIPNYTMVVPTAATAVVPPGKDYEITTEAGDFSVQACVKWARIVVSEPLTAVLLTQPADEAAELSVAHAADGMLKCQIMTLQGQPASEELFTSLSQNQRIRVSTSELASGTYFLRLADTSQQILVIKLIVRH